MSSERRKTFREIIREESPRMAHELETKAQTASRLAKIQPEHAAKFYAIKYTAVRELFRMPGHAPLIRDAWTTEAGILLSIRLTETGALLHFPFDRLYSATQQFFRRWASRRAEGKRWNAVISRLCVNRPALARHR